MSSTLASMLLLTAVSLSEGLTAVRAGNYEAAQQTIAAFISANPGHADVAQATLWLARLEQDPETARELYLRVVTRHSNTAFADSALYEAGSIDYAFGLYQQAATKWKELLSTYPASPLTVETYYWLGICYKVLGDEGSATSYLKKAEELGRGSLWASLATTELTGSAPDTSTATPPVTGGGYAVQVGSFTDVSRAENLLSTYQSQGRSGEIQEAVVSGRTYYRVRLGPFATSEEASAYAETLKAQGLSAMVVKR